MFFLAPAMMIYNNNCNNNNYIIIYYHFIYPYKRQFYNETMVAVLISMRAVVVLIFIRPYYGRLDGRAAS